ncbi:unnamed protein product [Blepharisma stoltei]|uniref:Uncharacterized protein n=1 Tax=Blepharisma stoltei TaxID=1481888 RepID=A0AAU9JV20_9CILI|nr:unnamed protein product [Blepharisma stoltei]
MASLVPQTSKESSKSPSISSPTTSSSTHWDFQTKSQPWSVKKKTKFTSWTTWTQESTLLPSTLWTGLPILTSMSPLDPFLPSGKGQISMLQFQQETSWEVVSKLRLLGIAFMEARLSSFWLWKTAKWTALPWTIPLVTSF